jgi:hypothetical protein
MTGPKLHPRQQAAAIAKTKLEIAFWDAVFESETDLTHVELLQAATSIQSGILKEMLRIERHGDVDKPAGWAYDDDE